MQSEESGSDHLVGTVNTSNHLSRLLVLGASNVVDAPKFDVRVRVLQD